MLQLTIAGCIALCLGAGCSQTQTFDRARTPSGPLCADMLIVPAGTKPERPAHRLAPVQSAPSCGTEAERLQSLRRAACALGADAVIEAANEDITDGDGRGRLVSSGTAVQWTR